MTDFAATECGIRQLQAAYADAVWRKDFDAFADCFAEDCEWRILGMVLCGRAEIKAAIHTRTAKFRRVLMTFRTPVLDINNGAVSGRTYVTEQNVFLDGRPWMAIGTYYEHFVDHGDRWRFAWRLFQAHYIGPPDLSSSFLDNPDYGPPPAMPPRDAIPNQEFKP
jgi:ketosteroid isomerase-like protein